MKKTSFPLTLTVSGDLGEMCGMQEIVLCQVQGDTLPGIGPPLESIPASYLPLQQSLHFHYIRHTVYGYLLHGYFAP